MVARFSTFLKEANYGPGDWGWGLPPKVDMKFKELAKQQRGKPEMAMLQVQNAYGGGILNPVVEHGGDVINRMNPAHPYGWAIDETLKKLDRVIGYLRSPYGFHREYTENLRANAKYKSRTTRKFDITTDKPPADPYGEDEYREEIEKKLKEYGDAHAELPVYNEAQWLAREAAVAVGNTEWSRAARYYEKLRDILENEPERTKEYEPGIVQYSPLINRARKFAIQAHGDQKRKYTGNPYWYHLRDVANIVRTAGLPDEAIAAAWLHDTVEDTPVTIDQVKDEFGDHIANLVDQLTDVSKPEDGNRAARKKIDREHYIGADPMAQSIKLADLINNTADITQNDPKFAKVYVAEKELLLPYLKKGNSKLFAYASKQVQKYKQELNNPCKHPWDRAKDKSRCGKRASN